MEWPGAGCAAWVLVERASVHRDLAGPINDQLPRRQGDGLRREGMEHNIACLAGVVSDDLDAFSEAEAVVSEESLDGTELDRVRDAQCERCRRGTCGRDGEGQTRD